MSLSPPTNSSVRNYPIRRALLSVTDKGGLLEFAQGLVARGVELVSTGGTAKVLRESGLAVVGVEEVTGFPEMMHGRVKTLHPKVHGGLLALRDHQEHIHAMQEHGIVSIDLLCVNLYAFDETVARPGCTRDEAIENIDIGGPSMIRSGAKNHVYVTVVTSPDDYAAVLADMDLHAGATSARLRASLAAQAFARTAAYDASIASYLLACEPGRVKDATNGGEPGYPDVLCLGARKVYDLRHGENPHQRGALYALAGTHGPSLAHATQHHGKELSYNNINDAAAAMELVCALKARYPARVGACCVKHTNPCGASIVRESASEPGHSAVRVAIEEAIAGDPLAAFGGIIACNAPIDASAAQRLCAKDVFLEVVVAPAFAPEALSMLISRWASIRLLSVPGMDAAPLPLRRGDFEVRSLAGGLLLQEPDRSYSHAENQRHVAGPKPSEVLLASAGFLEVIGRFLFSNAIVIGGPAPHSSRTRIEGDVLRMFGGGAGQMDRVAACRLAVMKAGELSRGAAAYSDAFFPFADGPALLIDAGVSLLMHPGGSKRDQDTLDICNERGVTCLLTGLRHFRH